MNQRINIFCSQKRKSKRLRGEHEVEEHGESSESVVGVRQAAFDALCVPLSSDLKVKLAPRLRARDILS